MTKCDVLTAMHVIVPECLCTYCDIKLTKRVISFLWSSDLSHVAMRDKRGFMFISSSKLRYCCGDGTVYFNQSNVRTDVLHVVMYYC